METAQTLSVIAKLSERERAAVDDLEGWIRRRTGIQYSGEKLELLVARLRNLCRDSGVDSLATLAGQVVSHATVAGPLVQQVMEAAVVQHTSFFREPDVLEEFAAVALNPLLARGNVRIWSCAASSGEEAYTLAMMAAERVGLAGFSDRVAVLGSDIGESALTIAEQAIYPADRVDQVPEPLRERYFEPAARGLFSVKPALRKAVMFRKLNLMRRPWPFRRQFHAVVCRNVLYYFEPETQRELLARLFEITKPRGFLLTSVTETVSDIRGDWHQVSRGVFQRP